MFAWHIKALRGLCVDINPPLCLCFSSRCLAAAAACLPCVCVCVSDPPGKLFHAPHSQKLLSSVCSHQEAAGYEHREGRQHRPHTHTHTHTHARTHSASHDQTLPPFFSIFSFPPLWLSPWRCYFIPSSWWVCVLLLWDVWLSRSTIKGPVCVCICVCVWRETAVLMNGLSVFDPDGSGPCLIGFHEDRDPTGVRRGAVTPAERGRLSIGRRGGGRGWRRHECVKKT